MVRLSVCNGCSESVDSAAVVSWRAVGGGRELFWLCGACGVRGSLVLSDVVLRLVSKADGICLPVDEGLVKFFADELSGVKDLGDVLPGWDFDVAVGAVPRDRVK